MKRTIFIYSGEGTSMSTTRFGLLKQTWSWNRIEEILKAKLELNLKLLWEQEIGSHRCPYSPLLTTITQICLSELWQNWGYSPQVVFGHSTGELAAAYQAGLYDLEDVIPLAYDIGEVGVCLSGVMMHGTLSPAEIANCPVAISSFNFEDGQRKHVTVSGYADEMEAFLQQHPEFVKMKLPHPWHHPDYRRFADKLKTVDSGVTEKVAFVSGVTSRYETRLADDYWQRWFVQPIDLIASMRTMAEGVSADQVEIIEIGFHPVLEKSCRVFPRHTHVSSMFRGEEDSEWILHQRRRLNQEPFLAKVKTAVESFKPMLDFKVPLAYQGLGSLEFTELSVLLRPFFPGLAPHDFYRYKTIDQLLDKFGAPQTFPASAVRPSERQGVVIAGMSCRFPAAVETLTQFWDMLLSRADQITPGENENGTAAGFLHESISRFDYAYFQISSAEAQTMDPQQILALELTEMLWRDAGIDPTNLDRRRVGIYIGVWNQEFAGDRTSVFYPTGTNPSIIAARISYHYDLRGPSWVSNTACSSSLTAVHYAAKDIEAGRVDYAVAGGVNLLLDPEYTANLRNAGFLSPDNRCKAFDDSADGYGRAEGGGLVLLVNKALAHRYYAEIAGSALNQNGGRPQLITAPHAEAQEELIVAACQDAGILPGEIAYLECHGTGTKIGDPIEISALKNTVAKNRKGPCYIGSVKSNFGHLESAAGIAGLIKSVVALHYGKIPPNLHYQNPNQHIDFELANVQVVTEETAIDPEAFIGISSFGFGGSNAHVIVKGVAASVSKPIQPVAMPFNRQAGTTLKRRFGWRGSEDQGNAGALETDKVVDKKNLTREVLEKMVLDLFFLLTGVPEIDPNIEMTDQGLDSLSGTELISQLEKTLDLEIGPELLLEFPLRDQFIDGLYALATQERVVQ